MGVDLIDIDDSLNRSLCLVFRINIVVRVSVPHPDILIILEGIDPTLHGAKLLKGRLVFIELRFNCSSIMVNVNSFQAPFLLPGAGDT